MHILPHPPSSLLPLCVCVSHLQVAGYGCRLRRRHGQKLQLSLVSALFNRTRVLSSPSETLLLSGPGAREEAAQERTLAKKSLISSGPAPSTCSGPGVVVEEGLGLFMGPRAMSYESPSASESTTHHALFSVPASFRLSKKPVPSLLVVAPAPPRLHSPSPTVLALSLLDPCPVSLSRLCPLSTLPLLPSPPPSLLPY